MMWVVAVVVDGVDVGGQVKEHLHGFERFGLLAGLMFSWRIDEPEERLNSLRPFHHFTAARRM